MLRLALVGLLFAFVVAAEPNPQLPSLPGKGATQSPSPLGLGVGEGASKQPPGTHAVKLNGHTFTLPEGFTIELVAGPPQADRPIVAALDEKGRLYVCDSSGSNAKTAEQVKTKPHRIVRLESTKGDGVYDKSTPFVKNVMFPEGAMWLNGSLYVAAPPHIWKFTDTNDDGVADKEEIWFDGKTLTGCANDLHGPYRGPDGYVYWCKGAFAKQEYTLPNGKPFTTQASHIFRAKPDGTGIEPVMTGGMDNPVDAVFMPNGDIIFSTTFFQHPRDGKRDGLIHAVYGGVYGKDHHVVYDHPWTSPQLMPVLTHMGPAAPAGLHRYESDQFGKDYENNIFCCQFNMRKVSRHVLTPKGSTYESKDSDFVVSDSLDFHPTDVIEDADGSLLIVDTGGWYKICCPTSQLVKPDVLGAIYRVKKVGAHKTRSKPVAPPLPHLYTVALKRDPAGFADAVAALTDANLHTRRFGATALGRIGNPKSIPAILEALTDEKNDRELDHALTYAIIEIGDAKETVKGLAHESPRVRRAALAALSNIPNSGLEAKAVLAELEAKDAALRETAWWVAGRNPQWGDQLAGYFRDRLKTADKLKPEERDELADRLVKFAGNAAIQKVIAEAVGSPASAPVALRVMTRSGLKAMPLAWEEGLVAAAPKLDRESYKAALGAFRVVPANGSVFATFVEAVPRAQLWPGGVVPDEFKLATLSARPVGQALGGTGATYLLAKIGRDEPAAERAAASDALSRSTLTAEQLLSLAAALKTVNPLDLGKLLGVYAKSTDEKVGMALVKALRDPAVRPALRAEMVQPILEKYPKTVKAEAENLYTELAEARKGERDKLEKMLSELKGGDIRRGQVVFNSQKANCIACHKVGYVGGLVGPDLTKIGNIRTERDLLEAIVFPSASFVRSYEPVRVVTTDERTFNGILKKDAPDEIIIIVAADKEERVARADVESVTPSSVSIMPAGLDQQLTTQDLADLVAFLMACK